MCGISGIWGPSDRQAIRAMVAAMDHRGPDDRGEYHDANIALAITRLSIIDTGSGGHQPMGNPDGTIQIVYNGEVYNYQSERRQLEARGYTFSSSSDTEVILRMYEHYGDDFLLRLRGMFALAIYDKRRGPGRERLLLARDHFGIKPLLFARAADHFIFASEMKALIASNLVGRELDPIALRLLLTYGSVSQPRTILRDVKMLLPGYRVIIDKNQERIERYCSLGINRYRDFRKQPYEELVSRMSDVLEESTRLHLVSDVPVGAFLSGGIDSSLLIAIIAKVIGRKIKTFSIGFEDEGAEFDETTAAERVAKYLGADHTSTLIRGIDVRDRIQHIAYSLDQPSVDGVNSYFISLAARQSVKVAISGTGSDEIFAGYYWFTKVILEKNEGAEKPWGVMAKALLAFIARRKALDRLLLKRGGDSICRARNCGGFLARYAEHSCSSFGTLGAARLLAEEVREQAQAGRSNYYDQLAIDELPRGSAVERMTGLCLRGYMTNQLLRDMDAVSMAHSLEVRVPYLDRVVVDTALSLPDVAKLGALSNGAVSGQNTYGETGSKRILFDVGRHLLPAHLDSQPKRGFILPFDAWLRGPLKEILSETLSDTQVKKRGLLDAKEVSRVKKQFMEGHINRHVGWLKPWLLIMLELWCREVLDKPIGSRGTPDSSLSQPNQHSGQHTQHR